MALNVAASLSHSDKLYKREGGTRMSSASTVSSTSALDNSVEKRLKRKVEVILRDFPTVLKPMLKDKRQPIEKIKDTAWNHVINELRRVSPHADDQKDLMNDFHDRLNKLIDTLQEEVLAQNRK